LEKASTLVRPTKQTSAKKEERTREGKCAPIATARLEGQRLKRQEPEQMTHMYTTSIEKNQSRPSKGHKSNIRRRTDLRVLNVR
jgi:hypothetical protein